MLTGLLVSLGCSSSRVDFTPTYERKYFGVAVRRNAPEPVYNRIRYAYAPEPVPNREVIPVSNTRLSPIFQFDLDKVSLEQAARVLASTARYTSYTSSVIARRKVTLNTLGTIDEIADAIAKQAGIRVIIDHDNREVRFLANGGSHIVQRNFYKPASGSADQLLNEEIKVSEKKNGFLNKIEIEG